MKEAIFVVVVWLLLFAIIHVLVTTSCPCPEPTWAYHENRAL